MWAIENLVKPHFQHSNPDTFQDEAFPKFNFEKLMNLRLTEPPVLNFEKFMTFAPSVNTDTGGILIFTLIHSIPLEI
jgi:hypothetical protein